MPKETKHVDKNESSARLSLCDINIVTSTVTSNIVLTGLGRLSAPHRVNEASACYGSRSLAGLVDYI